MGQINQDKVVDLLAAGLGPTVVAETLGCDVSYISQLQHDPAILARIQEKRLAKASQQVTTDNKVADIRSKLVDRLHEVVPFMSDPIKIVQALAVVDKIDRKVLTRGMPQSGNTIVQLRIPQHTAVQFKLSPQREVIEIEGRTLTRLPANEVQALLANHTQKANSGALPTPTNDFRELTAEDL